jgi:A118 family predicted phage portal protein
MFRTLWNWIKEVFGRVLGSQTVARALKITPIVSDKMANAIELWDSMYKGMAPWVREPDGADPTRVVSLGIPAFIASEKARMATLEMKSEITDGKKDEDRAKKEELDVNALNTYAQNSKDSKTSLSRAEYLNKTYQNKVIKKIRPQLEYGIAKGGLVIKPYVVPKYDGSYDIEVEYVQADAFFPLSFDGSDKITEAAFVQSKVDKDKIYRRLEHHKLDGRNIIITNRAFVTKVNQTIDISNSYATDLGQEISLAEVPEWSALEKEVTIKNVDSLLFAYYKQPEANIIDPYSPLGISGFGRAVSLIKDADLQYSRLLWEFEATEAAIDVDRDALMELPDPSGNFHITKPFLQQRLFRKIDLGTDDTYEPFLPTIRQADLTAGLNTILMKIEDACSLSRGTLSSEDIEAKTATELKILKQRSYAANSDIQKALEYALREVIYIMDVYCTLYNIAPDGKYEVSFEWDDSILTDNDEELNKRILLMQNGVASKVELRMWYFGETKSQAEVALEKIGEENRKAMEENAKLQALIAQQTYTNETTNKKDTSLPAAQNGSARNQVKENTEQNQKTV